jgi:hypothetical protein
LLDNSTTDAPHETLLAPSSPVESSTHLISPVDSVFLGEVSGITAVPSSRPTAAVSVAVKSIGSVSAILPSPAFSPS